MVEDEGLVRPLVCLSWIFTGMAGQKKIDLCRIRCFCCTLHPIQCFFDVDNREFLLYSNASNIKLSPKSMLE